MSHTVDATGTPATTDYLWDVNRSLPVILQDGTNTYVYGLSLIAAIDGANNETYYMYDGLGSTTELTDDNGDVTDTYEYDVFGAVRGGSATSDNPFQFTGQQTDADSGLQYLRARYYDPSVGRFLSRDPLGFGDGYSYAANNPATLTDPSGLCPYDDTGCMWHTPPRDKEGGFGVGPRPIVPTPIPTITPTPRPTPKPYSCESRWGLLPDLPDWACWWNDTSAAWAEEIDAWLIGNTSEECRQLIAENWAEHTGTEGVYGYYDLETPQWLDAVELALEGGLIGTYCALDRP